MMNARVREVCWEWGEGVPNILPGQEMSSSGDWCKDCTLLVMICMYLGSCLDRVVKVWSLKNTT